MDTSNWERVKQVFGSALEREPTQRNAFLAEACGGDESLRQEVESLLAAHQGAATTMGGTGSSDGAAAKAAPTPEDAISGRRIGAYQILNRIGQGGMAAVYLGVRADDQYRKRVAIKLIPPGLDTEELLRRFRNERQTLAALEHANIVRLLDGGTTEDGLPYLVMDYVEGTPIDQYCDTHRLSTDERLRLFMTVCAAVHYAHQNLVIHRDLKPSNVLVTGDGVPKLLDFGIAKVLKPEFAEELVVTQTATRHLTPAYASPEQIKGEPLTNASDIYSLGVLVYELLTGHRPYRLKTHTPLEMERAVCEEEPVKPSTVVTQAIEETLPDGTAISTSAEEISRTREGDPKKLRSRLYGDLDAIVMTALRKEPQRRYASVDHFSEDIRRHLEHLPVKARPSTIRYRGTKLIRRHRETLAATLVLLVLFGSVATWQAHRASVQRVGHQIGNPNFNPRRSVAVLGFKNLSGRPDAAWLSMALSEMMTTELAAGEKLRLVSGENVARMKIDLSLPEADSYAPGTLGKIRGILGVDEVVLGSYLDLGNQVRLDLKVQDAASGETVDALVENGTENDLSTLVSRTGDELRQKLGIGAVTQEQAVTVKASLPSNPEAARLYSEGLAKLRTFDNLAARDLLEKAITLEPSFALAHSALASAWQGLGYDTRARDEAQKAFQLSSALSREERLWIEGQYRETTKEWDKAVGVYHTLFNSSPDNPEIGLRLANTQISAGKVQDALATVGALRKHLARSDDDPRIYLTEADAAYHSGDYKRTESVIEQAVNRARARGQKLIAARSSLLEARVFEFTAQTDKAIAAAEAARETYASVQDRNGVAEALELKADYDWQRQGDVEAALKTYEQASAIFREVGNRAGTANMLFAIGTAEGQRGDIAEAIEKLKGAAEIYREIDDKRHVGWTLVNLASWLGTRGDLKEALKRIDEAHTIFHEVGERDGEANALNSTAWFLATAGNLAEAKQTFEKAFRIFQELGAKADSMGPLWGLGRVALQEGDLVASRQSYEKVLEISKEVGLQATATSKTTLALLAIEEGHPADVEVPLREALTELRREGNKAMSAYAAAELSQSLRLQGRVSDAAKEIATLSPFVLANNQDVDSRLTYVTEAARVEAALGKTAEAMKKLDAVRAEAKRHGFLADELEARLALGEIEMKSGPIADGRARLAALEKDATAKGFGLIARKAAAAAKGQLDADVDK